MSMTSFLRKLRSRTWESDSTRRLSKEDEMLPVYHSESDFVYLRLLLYTTTREIKHSSIPKDSWSYDDQRVWLFKTLVEVCGRPDYNAYDIATRWENISQDLYELKKRDWQNLLVSYKDGGTIHRILRKMEKKASEYGPDADDMTIYMTRAEIWAANIRKRWRGRSFSVW
ncbi:hypothetical protein SBOR_0710 [Sclerotinia borealis F-4128]|uniref:Uncharacterized protein n=1 Tax=Sclerotinia borealis (strain F-4128) TaxID=1432307 RepID=W9CPZ0_SCLBF|nr:hypothetical protein SBOR_0710 [Sclerotinia borealis F-4128]